MTPAQLTDRAQAVIADSDEYTAPIFRDPSVGDAGKKLTSSAFSEDAERKAFEEYERTHHWQPLERWANTYKNATVRNRWTGWKARAIRPVATGETS
jgi:hypothetical protein